MGKLLIIGAGGHGKVIRELAESTGVYDAIDFIDDNSVTAIGRVDDLEKFRSKYQNALVSIGNNELRAKLYKKIVELGYEIPILIHSTAYISESCQIGRGTVVEPKAIINSNVLIGEGCIISPGTIIDHDVVLGEYVHANSGSIIMAGSTVDSFSKIDAGCVFRNK